jgi:hypothetical protein
MADGKSSTGKGNQSGGSAKRPYATLDLKATEIKAPAAKTDSAASPSGAAPPEPRAPLPAAASSYAASKDTHEQPNSGARMKSESDKSEKNKTAASASATDGASTAARTASSGSDPKVIVERRGGFFTHLVAGIVGGALSFLALQWAVPELGLDGTARFTNNTAALSERIEAIEKRVSLDASASDLNKAEDRIASLERTAQTIPALTDSQRRLVAETKAALASAASDSGSTQLIDRIGKVEEKLKAMADAGANDPNPSRIEQLAGVTAKVSDLENSLSTQLAALRANVTKDVESRMQAVTAASETAQAGTQRLDKDVASIKADTARIEASVNANKDATAQVAADLKAAQDQTTQLKTALDTLKNEAAKPAEITAAVAPIAERTAALEKSVQQVMQSESTRQKTAEQVVLALELQSLKRAIDSGQNYAGQLSQVKKLAGNTVDLTALTDLQDKGAPTLAQLKKDFRSAADAAMDTDAEAKDSGVVGRLWAEAKSVVRVRRIDLKPDDKSTEATLGRMQVALNDGRLGDVLEASKDLSPAAQDAARPFLEKLESRVGVDNTLAQLEAQLKSSIAPGPAPAANSAR